MEGDLLHGMRLPSLVPTSAVGIPEYVTATESMPPSSRTEGAIASASSPKGMSVRVEGLMKTRSDYASAVEFEIEASKVHWSELTATSADDVNVQSSEVDATSDDDKENGESDEEVFARLQKSSAIFQILDWEVGKKIAEGGQADIFQARSGGVDNGIVLKVMREGYRLRDLEKQWPLGMLHNYNLYVQPNCCRILGAFLSKSMNGRFAFWMLKYWGDLRKLIDKRMEFYKNQCPPFTKEEVAYIVRGICSGMEELHAHNIVHRDLKASNVLISVNGVDVDLTNLNLANVHVADFECSVGVVGTRYWRAPEILQGVQQRDIMPEQFTKESDVYAFGMTCYEVLTGRIPFEELGDRCYDVVIEGGRPQLLESIDPRWRELLDRCWDENPLKRPSIREIRKCLEELFSI